MITAPCRLASFIFSSFNLTTAGQLRCEQKVASTNGIIERLDGAGQKVNSSYPVLAKIFLSLFPFKITSSSRLLSSCVA